MRKLYLIKEVSTNTWCNSCSNSSFSTNIDSAIIFYEKSHATDAVDFLNKEFKESGNWVCNGSLVLSKDKDSSPPLFEVACFDLTPSDDLVVMKKTYSGESIADMDRDISESVQPDYNPVICKVPVDNYGFLTGCFTVSVTWKE